MLETLQASDRPFSPHGFEDWSRVLSLGEQQRLAAARCLTTSLGSLASGNPSHNSCIANASELSNVA